MIRYFHVLTLAIFTGCSFGQTNFPITMNNKEVEDFPYEMIAEQKAKFIEMLKTFRAGDSYEEVRKRIGNPGDESTIRGKKYDAPMRGIMATYYMKKNHRDLINEKNDEYVLLVFDNDKKLIRIRTNVSNYFFPLTATNSLWVKPDDSHLNK